MLSIFIQCSLIHILGLGQLALVRIKKAQIMKRIIALRVTSCISDFNVVELPRTVLCMWNQSLLRKPILSFSITRHGKANGQESEHQEFDSVVADRLCTSIMNNRMDRVALHVLK